MAPASSATVRDAATALYVPDAAHVDNHAYHGADEHAYAVALCTAAHHNPAAADPARYHVEPDPAASTVARAAPGAAKSGYAAPPVGVNCLSGS